MSKEYKQRLTVHTQQATGASPFLSPYRAHTLLDTHTDACPVIQTFTLRGSNWSTGYETFLPAFFFPFSFLHVRVDLSPTFPLLLAKARSLPLA